MRKIYNMDGLNISEAWIGGSAPVPDGWHLDVNTAMEKNKPSSDKLSEMAIEKPKKRGRPRKVAE